MRVDVVAAPVRYPRGPLLLLLIIAIVPAIALLVLHQWAQAEADEYDDSRGAVADVGGPNEPGSAPPALVTPVVDFRRTPESNADQASSNRLRQELRSLWQFVDDNSCGAVSVDGLDVGDKNPSVEVLPASNQKLLTGAVALHELGEDHRFVTEVRGPRQRQGVIEGDVYLVGGGDPLLTTDDFALEGELLPAFNTTSLDVLADRVVAKGVTSINGAVLGDGSRYDDEYSVDSWAPGDYLTQAGPYDALMVNDSYRVGISGKQSDPVDAAAEEFVRLLEARGVTVADGAGTGDAPDSLRLLGRVTSQPLTAIVEELLVNSDNNTAELLLKEIGYAARGQGTRVAGLNVVDSTLRNWGVPMEGVRSLDGSGLSLDNSVTCAAILSILQRHTDGVLPDLLPVAGRTGTLTLEFTESPMAGRLAAKTGTLYNEPIEEDPLSSKALGGYVPAPRRSTIEFVLILNTPDAAFDRNFAPLWQQLGTVLDTYPSGPGPARLGPRTAQ